LVEQGRLTLDDPVGGRLAAWLGVAITDPAMADVTVRHLLTQTSGLPVYQRTFFGGTAGSCAEAARRGLAGSLASPPGTQYRYANLNYCLLGLLVEDVTGQPYEEAARALVLDRVGAGPMRIAGTEDVRPGEAAQPTTPTRLYMEALGGAGAWLGTPSDLVRIVSALDPSQTPAGPLDAATADLMRTPAPVAYEMPDRWYGMGLIVFTDGSWGHTGTLEGARVAVFHRPDGLTWAVTVSGDAPTQSDRLIAYVNDALVAAGWSP
jgi:D-alanyl-D-alanine carboxypeptidase